MKPIYSGDEHFTFNGMPNNRLVSDFWTWLSSDLKNDAVRNILAEYIVSTALDLDSCGVRQTAGPFEIMLGSTTITVKSTSYLRSTDGLYAPLFGIAPTYVKDPDQLYVRTRKPSLYIFCLLDCMNSDVVNPIQLEQWRFFVLPSSVLDEECGDKKTITVRELKALNPTETDYENLQSVVMNYVKNL